MLVVRLMALALALTAATAKRTARPAAGAGAAGVDHTAYDGYCHAEATGDASRTRRLVLQVGACRFTPPCGPPPPPAPAPPAGFITKTELRLPEVQAPPALEKYNFDIPDKCRQLGKQLVGTTIHACDVDAAPTVLVAGSGVGYACLERHGARLSTAHVYILQYCL